MVIRDVYLVRATDATFRDRAPWLVGLGLWLIIGLFAIGVGCAVRVAAVNARVVRLAQDHVSMTLGCPVRIANARLTTGWWLRLVESETRKTPH